MPVDRKLDRRDFIKLATAGVAAVAMACGQWDKVLAPGVTETATPPPTSAVEGQVIFGIGEFTSGDPSLVGSIRDLLREGFNLQIDDEGAKSIIPFSIKYDTSEFDFVSLPPLENSDLEISFGEKIFMRIDNALVDLDRREVDSDGIRLVTWSFLNLETNKPEPVLWYPALTTEQWEGLTQEQIKDLYAGFAPPTPLELTIPGYSRNLDRVFAISFLGLPEGAFKVRAALRPIEVKPTETPAPEYKVGIQQDGTIALNQVNLSARLTDADGDGHIDGISQTQLDRELAYLSAHPEITGRNQMADGIHQQSSLPYPTLGTLIDTENILAVNQDPAVQTLYEIVYAQANPDGTQRAVVHMLIDLQIQQYMIDLSHNPGYPARNILPDQLEQLRRRTIEEVLFLVFMNSEGNDLKNDPLFANVRKIVEEEGTGLRNLLLFSISKYAKPDDFAQLADKVNSSLFITPYAVLP